MSSDPTWNGSAVNSVLLFCISSAPVVASREVAQISPGGLTVSATALACNPETRERGLSGGNRVTEGPAKQMASHASAPGPNSSEEGSQGSQARGFLGMEHGASAGPRSGLAPTATAGWAHTGPAVSQGRQQPHAPVMTDEGLRPRSPDYTPRAAILALRAAKRRGIRRLPSSTRRSRRARKRHTHWTAAPGRANQRARSTLAGVEALGRCLDCTRER